MPNRFNHEPQISFQHNNKTDQDRIDSACFNSGSSGCQSKSVRISASIVEKTIGFSRRGLQSTRMLQPRPPDLSTSLERLRHGDENARLEVLQCAKERLLRLTSKMLKDFPSVHRWEDTDDVFQNACMRLHRSLAAVTFPTVADFFRFASSLIRRELVDLSRHYQGPLGHGTHQARQVSRTDSFTPDRLNPGTDTHDPQQIMIWTEFHEAIERLSEDERQMFDLLWYQELSQPAAAKILGVSERTIQRRWQLARIRLQELLANHES